ncbi:MAG: arginine--tRNA ligase [Bacteroidota bacterium]
MNAIELIKDGVTSSVNTLYGQEIDSSKIVWNLTRKEFEGDFTVVVFPYTKLARKGPEQVAKEIGDFLVANLDIVESYNVIKGFLNLVIADSFWKGFLEKVYNTENYGKIAPNGRKVMVEFSSPNTNKPLHLGHIRNILLGWSTSRIMEMAGYEVIKVQIVNDRGVHICKSMVAWLKFGNGETPESSGLKGDHLIGKYYVLYSKEETAQKAALAEQGIEDDEPAILKEARAMLRKWENGDEDVIQLWKKMNGWVYDGFEATYKNLGVHFDKYYYESDTYLLGKDIIADGLGKGLFYEKADSSVWIDLSDVRLDEKIVRRSDGTSVYMTQDLGTARLRFQDFGAEKMVYVVGDEQDYHFKVLFEILKRLGEPYAEGLYHLSYGMVNLPTGKMKSREGTVVDADDLIHEVVYEAKSQSLERGELLGLEESEKEVIWKDIGLSALKYHMLKVHPKKSMLYDPKESLELQGQTGPYIQNAYVRVAGVFRNLASEFSASKMMEYEKLESHEKETLLLLHQFPAVVQSAASEYDPSEIAHYAYDLAKTYHRFYHEHSILKAPSDAAKSFRLALSQAVGNVLGSAMDLLGIEMPERM